MKKKASGKAAKKVPEKVPGKKTAPPEKARPEGKGRARQVIACKADGILRPEFYRDIAEIIGTARGKVCRAIDSLMIGAYWDLGRRIVEEEQSGKQRADYGSALLRHLSLRLEHDFGKGFTERNLRNFRQFYLCFSIRHALRAELSWTRYRALIRVEDAAARTWYMNEAADRNWSSRALERQIRSLYHQRLLSSRDPRPVIGEMLENTAALACSPRDFIRDPVVLEFLDLPAAPSLRESALEQAIIDKLQHFLLEPGKGFAFVARQQRVSTETKDFFIDLVFYHYLLKCFVLIDLKIGELTHADIGQMDMYVRLYEDQHKGPGDNPTVGLILCTEKDHTVVKYSILNDSRRIFASKYQLYLPSEDELRREIETQRDNVLRELAAGDGHRGTTKRPEGWE